MVTLRNFTEEDADIIWEYRYPDMSLEEIRKMIGDWNKKIYQGKFFEMYAVEKDGVVAGTISLQQKSANVVSCGPEIFLKYRRQGLGKEAMRLALQAVKEKGYKIALQQIRTDNAASIALHQSLEFETSGYIYKNQKGNEVLVFAKAL